MQPVTGTVTLDGQAINGAAVTFKPVEGGTGMPAVGTTDESGVFKVTDMRSDKIGSGAMVGEYKVGVLWYKPSSTANASATGGDSGSEDVKEDKKARQQATGPDALLPVAYQNPETSGLTATVVDGSNEFKFELTSSYKAPAAKK